MITGRAIIKPKPLHSDFLDTLFLINTLTIACALFRHKEALRTRYVIKLTWVCGSLFYILSKRSTARECFVIIFDKPQVEVSIYLIISEIEFVVCSSRTIFGKKSKCPCAFGKLSWKMVGNVRLYMHKSMWYIMASRKRWLS